MISSKLIKVVSSFRVSVYDAGFLFECDGWVDELNMSTFRSVATDINGLNALITQFMAMPRA